ncbi:MAG: MBG domain-containing protein, partial [Bacteroidota bacterium]
GTSIAITSTCSLGGANAGNYSLTQPTLTARDITALALTVTGATTSNKVYDRTNTATVTGGSLVGIISPDVVTLTQSGTFAQTGVGTSIAITSTCSLGGANAGNYSLTQPSLTARDITAATVTITPDASQNKVYGASDPTYTYTASPSVSVTGTLSRATGENVATYAYTIGTLSAGSNYSLTLNGTNTFAITPATLTYTANAASKTYGAANPSFSGTVTGFVGSDNQSNATTGTLSFTSSATTTSTPGSYAITGSGLMANNGNYTFAQASGNSSAFTINAGVAGTWIGIISNAYNNPANWADNNVPGSSVNVSIASGATYPTVSTTQSVNNLTISSGATVTVTGTLNIAGNISNSGTLDASAGTIVLNGSSAQTVSGGFTVQNITVNNTSGGVSLGATSADTVYVTGVYTPTAGTLTTNGRLVLVSNALGTASVAAGSGNYISGNLVVQRYHTSKRAWLLISAPLTTYGSGLNGSIHNNWQQQTFITAPPSYANPATNSNGMDSAVNNTYGMLRWTGSSWGRVLNTINDTSLIGNQGGTTADNKPFFLFVRGDRSILPTAGSTNASAVTFRATGALQTGNKTFSYSNTSSYALVANPYPAPIDLTSFLGDNSGLTSGNTNTYIYYWNPNISTTGGYTTAVYNNGSWNYTSNGVSGNTGGNAQPSFIQSGQAFFVTTNNTSSVIFKETQKSTGNSTNTVFGKNPTPTINVDLSKGTNYIDGVMTMYNNNYNAAVIAPTEDAYKFWGNEEGVAIARTATNLSVEARPEIVGADTTFLFMNKMVAGNTYNFKVTANNIPANVTGVLVDKYLNTNTALDLTVPTNINFTVDTAAAAKSASRFMIVLNSKAPLYVSDIKVKASVKAKSAVIDWSVATEKEVKSYTVEHSTSGNDFKSINTTVAKNANNSNYSYTDNNANTGDNYYRIKAINVDGSVQYSSIAKVTIGDRNEGISIYPNPIVGKTMNVQMSNIAEGTYSLSMTNANGQQVMEQQLQHAGGSVTSTVQLPTAVASGIYQLRLTSNGKSYTETVIVK